MVWTGFGRVCMLHFDKDDLHPNGLNKVKLSSGAVPCVLPNDSDSDLDSDSNLNEQNAPDAEICQLLRDQNTQLKYLLENTQAVLADERLSFNGQMKSLQAKKIELLSVLDEKNMELAFLNKTLREFREIYESDTKVKLSIFHLKQNISITFLI